MPKQEKNRPFSYRSQSRASPYPCNSSSSHHRPASASNPPMATPKDVIKWDEVLCSVCMEHPHNAVLLSCSSGNKGCQPFMCDTSYRHSNCLDQYKKASSELSCPLCRGGVIGWHVDEPARRYMNSKVRSCSKESCGFSGTYLELRKHARKEHPTDRPSEADPDRQQNWQRMERRRDIGDLFSTIQGAMDSGEDSGGYESVLEEDEFEFDHGEVGPGTIFQISPIAVLFFIRYRRFEGGGGEWASSSSRRRRERGDVLSVDSNSESTNAVMVMDDAAAGGSGVVDSDDDNESDEVTLATPQRGQEERSGLPSPPDDENDN